MFLAAFGSLRSCTDEAYIIVEVAGRSFVSWPPPRCILESRLIRQVLLLASVDIGQIIRHVVKSLCDVNVSIAEPCDTRVLVPVHNSSCVVHDAFILAIHLHVGKAGDPGQGLVGFTPYTPLSTSREWEDASCCMPVYLKRALLFC